MLARMMRSDRAVGRARGQENFWQHVLRLVGQPFWWAEVFAAIMLTLWAAVNLGDGSALSPKYFGPLLRLEPEQFWEGLALIVGIFQITALTFDHRLYRAGSCFIAAWLFGSVVYAMLLSGSNPPGVIVLYAGMGGLDLLGLYLNIRGSQRGFR